MKRFKIFLSSFAFILAIGVGFATSNMTVQSDPFFFEGDGCEECPFGLDQNPNDCTTTKPDPETPRCTCSVPGGPQNQDAFDDENGTCIGPLWEKPTP